MTKPEYQEWLKSRVIATWWWCGDEECNCTQPQIERITPNTEIGYPFIRRETLWEGTFRSDASPEEGAEQAKELREACPKFGIPVPEWLESP